MNFRNFVFFARILHESSLASAIASTAGGLTGNYGGYETDDEGKQQWTDKGSVLPGLFKDFSQMIMRPIVGKLSRIKTDSSTSLPIRQSIKKIGLAATVLNLIKEEIKKINNEQHGHLPVLILKSELEEQRKKAIEIIKTTYKDRMPPLPLSMRANGIVPEGHYLLSDAQVKYLIVSIVKRSRIKVKNLPSSMNNIYRSLEGGETGYGDDSFGYGSKLSPEEYEQEKGAPVFNFEQEKLRQKITHQFASILNNFDRSNVMNGLSLFSILSRDKWADMAKEKGVLNAGDDPHAIMQAFSKQAMKQLYDAYPPDSPEAKYIASHFKTLLLPA